MIPNDEISIIRVDKIEGEGLIARWEGESPIIKISDPFVVSTNQYHPGIILPPDKQWEIGMIVQVFEWELEIIDYEPGTWTLKRIGENTE